MQEQLSAAVRITAKLRERLKETMFLADGDEALETTIEGESDLNEMLATIAREAVQADAMAEGLKAIIKANQERKSRLESKAERLRAIVFWAMEDSGTKKITAPDLTLSLSNGRAPVIIDELLPIPNDYLRIKTEPDKTLIRSVLERGTNLPFARLGNPMPVLTIRNR